MEREFLRIDVLIGRLKGRISLIIRFKGRRSDVKGSSPLMDLFGTILGSSFSFVESLKSAIVSLIEMEVLDNRDVGFIDTVENVPAGVDGSLEGGSESDIEGEAGFLEKLAASDGFLDTLFGEFDIRPTGEQVELVPFTFAMADQN